MTEIQSNALKVYQGNPTTDKIQPNFADIKIVADAILEVIAVATGIEVINSANAEGHLDNISNNLLAIQNAQTNANITQTNANKTQTNKTEIETLKTEIQDMKNSVDASKGVVLAKNSFSESIEDYYNSLSEEMKATFSKDYLDSMLGEILTNGTVYNLEIVNDTNLKLGAELDQYLGSI